MPTTIALPAGAAAAAVSFLFFFVAAAAAAVAGAIRRSTTTAAILVAIAAVATVYFQQQQQQQQQQQLQYYYRQDDGSYDSPYRNDIIASTTSAPDLSVGKEEEDEEDSGLMTEQHQQHREEDRRRRRPGGGGTPPESNSGRDVDGSTIDKTFGQDIAEEEEERVEENNKETQPRTGTTPSSSTPSSSSSSSKKKEQQVVYVVGDLHGDVKCARYWVNKTGLISGIIDEEKEDLDSSNSNSEQNWKWIGGGNAHHHLVFIGDYVDKGPTSKQTLEFVMSLTQKFPNNVHAVLGNHEMELLLDRDAVINTSPPGDGDDRHSSRRLHVWGEGSEGYYQLNYASVHPGEYLNYNDAGYVDGDVDVTDRTVVDALYNATLESYGHGLHGRVHIGVADDSKSILQFVPLEIRETVRRRLPVLQSNYLNAFRSGTELGSWLEKLPIAIVVDDTLFVHGGVDARAAQLLSEIGVDGINELYRKYSREDTLSKFVTETYEGQVIYNMLTYRGNHNLNACPSLKQTLLPSVSVKRLCVGHTPASHIRVSCDDTFLAVDSSLGRWFRNSGNEYCRGTYRQVSQNGRYQCNVMNDRCEGQILRIVDGVPEIIQ